MIEDDDIILVELKRLLEIESETTEFDMDVLASANAAFFTLYELGIGPNTPFYMTDTTTWDKFETTIPKPIILDYIFLKTKLVFDPPSSSFVLEAFKDRINELEFRMNIYVDDGGGTIVG